MTGHGKLLKIYVGESQQYARKNLYIQIHKQGSIRKNSRRYTEWRPW